jgi:hypothetical protein
MSRLGELAFFVLLVGASVIANAQTPSGSSLHASKVLADIKSQGARAVVTALRSDNVQWNRAMANIGRGTPEWLHVAVALRSGTDAGASETLDEAVFLALKTAPVAVLKMLKDGHFDTKAVCSSNIGIDYTPAESRRFIDDRIKILTGLPHIEALAATHHQCLEGLRSALADFDDSKANPNSQ